MKKTYVTPEISLTLFKLSDVVLLSPNAPEETVAVDPGTEPPMDFDDL